MCNRVFCLLTLVFLLSPPTVLIFALQFVGSQKVGLTYGPIVVAWFLFIGITGSAQPPQFPFFFLSRAARSTARRPRRFPPPSVQRINENGGSIFEAWNPYHLRQFWTRGTFKGETAWHSYGGIFLSVTGAEALFADQGHFGLKAIAIAWFCLVYPMLRASKLFKHKTQRTLAPF